jgi:hypothetical protein
MSAGRNKGGLLNASYKKKSGLFADGIIWNEIVLPRPEVQNVALVVLPKT